MTVHNLRTILTAGALAGIAGLAFADGLPPGYGVETPSGSNFTTEIGNVSDVDDYVFDGYLGMKLTAKLKILKGSVLAPLVELVRPDGTIVPVAVNKGDPGASVKTKGKTVTAKFGLDTTGRWKVRIKRNPTSGTQDYGKYSINVKYTGPKFPKDKDTARNPNTNQYAYAVPATGGAKVNFTFKFKGGPATFGYFADGNGVAVPEEAGTIKELKKKIQGKNFVIPEDFGPGNFTVAFNDDIEDPIDPVTKTAFTLNVKLPKGENKRKAELSSFEPILTGAIFPSIGGPGTQVFVSTQNGLDLNDIEGSPTITVGGVALVDLKGTQDPTNPSKHTWIGTVPNAFDVDFGTLCDLVFTTSLGQVVVAENAFKRVPPPTLTAISQPSGTANGGFPLTLIGTNFNVGKDSAGQPLMSIYIDGAKTIVVPTAVTPNTVTFNAPRWNPGPAVFGVKDAESLLRADLGLATFTFLATAEITRVTPNLSPTLGGENIYVNGVQFTDDDTLWLEDESGAMVEITDADPFTPGIQDTYVDEQRHEFVAPPRARGRYQVLIRDPQNQPTNGLFYLYYFTFADFTAELNLASQVTASEQFDAWSTFLGDYNDDGEDDLFLARIGEEALGSTPQTRVLRNDGDGSFTNVTATVMPATTATDDWRADRVWLADVTEDGWPDLLLATNSTNFPANDRSHVRILRSTRRTGGEENDRVFVEITDDLMPAVRLKAPFSFSGDPGSVADNWRAQDMWVGDIDSSGGGIPEILIVHDEIKNEPNTHCGNYCTSPQGSSATYNFYWGGARAFRWNAGARGGQGQFDFDEDFFPRKSGVGVPIPIPGGGGTIIGCSQGCEGKFTPFIGQVLRVGHLDTDGKLDVMVLSSGTVTRDSGTISSLQVGLNRPDNTEGSSITDVTGKLTALGGDLRGTALAIGSPFDFFGTLAIANGTASGSNALRLIQGKPSAVPGELIDFTDITSQKLPLATGQERFQAADLAFVDTNGDSLQDLVLLAPAAIDNGMAFRILRSVVENNEVQLEFSFKSLLDPLGAGTDKYDGAVLAIGDLNGDGAQEYIITRTVIDGMGSQTRAITTEIAE